MTLFIPGPLSNPLNGSHRHWSVRAKWAKTWREKTFLHTRLAMQSSKPDPWAPKHILFTAHVWSLMDDDGLRAALKPVRDGLVDAGIIQGDGPNSGHRFDYFEIILRKDRGVEITINVREALG